jgi:hypothetical protein
MLCLYLSERDVSCDLFDNNRGSQPVGWNYLESELLRIITNIGNKTVLPMSQNCRSLKIIRSEGKVEERKSFLRLNLIHQGQGNRKAASLAQRAVDRGGPSHRL